MITTKMNDDVIDETIEKLLNEFSFEHQQILHVAKCNIEKSNYNIIIDMLQMLQQINDERLRQLIIDYKFLTNNNHKTNAQIENAIDATFETICNYILCIAK